MLFVIDRERCGSLLRLPNSSKDDGAVPFGIGGVRTFATYCGPCGPVECRGADDDEGYPRKCLLAPLEVLDMDEAVDIRLGARCRCRVRCMLPTPDKSSRTTPPTLPISVSVRSIEETPRPTRAGKSELGGRCAVLPDVRLRADTLEALDVRPPPLGSRSESIVLRTVGYRWRRSRQGRLAWCKQRPRAGFCLVRGWVGRGGVE